MEREKEDSEMKSQSRQNQEHGLSEGGREFAFYPVCKEGATSLLSYSPGGWMAVSFAVVFYGLPL